MIKIGNVNIMNYFCDSIGISIKQVIEYNDKKYRFSSTNILETYENGKWEICECFSFGNIMRLLQDYQFSSEWTPKDGDIVYIISFIDDSLCEARKFISSSKHLNNLLKNKLLFQTKEDAVYAAKKYIEQRKEGNIGD